jgi:hypothetical protein
VSPPFIHDAVATLHNDAVAVVAWGGGYPDEILAGALSISNEDPFLGLGREFAAKSFGNVDPGGTAPHAKVCEVRMTAIEKGIRALSSVGRGEAVPYVDNCPESMGPENVWAISIDEERLGVISERLP